MKKCLLLVQTVLMLALLFSCAQPQAPEGGPVPILNRAENVSRAVVGEWKAWTTYKQGDQVTYNSKLYSCRQPHTAIPGWDPVAVPALWEYAGGVVIKVPAVPTGLKAVAAGSDTINLTWNSSADAAEYEVVSGTMVVALVTTTSFSHTGLTPNTTYSYQVRAKNSAGTSALSAAVSAKTIDVTTVPAVPTGLSAKGVSKSRIDLSWTASAGAASYEIEADGVVKTTVTATSFSHTGLLPATTHSYRVRALNKNGASGWTTAVIATTLQDTPIGVFKERVLSGYWETWDATIHSAGHIPLNNISNQYNVINVAFPVILADGTCILEDNMAPTEDVPEPHEIAQAQAAGKKVILSIGGAAASINLNSDAVVDNFIKTCIAVLTKYGYDGIDIDIEAGLVCGSSMTNLSVSQKNLIRIIISITDHFGPDFLLTMAPETAYVTGGTVAYGGPWGAYLPIIDAVRDRLDWIQMQYYNGSMYGKTGSYNAGTVIGMVKQTEALIDGFNIAGNGFFKGLPASKVVIGLPAITGAGGGYMPPGDVQNGFNQLIAKYPNLRGLMTWSINWDASNGYEYANNHGPYLKKFGDIK